MSEAAITFSVRLEDEFSAELNAFKKQVLEVLGDIKTELVGIKDEISNCCKSASEEFANVGKTAKEQFQEVESSANDLGGKLAKLGSDVFNFMKNGSTAVMSAYVAWNAFWTGQWPLFWAAVISTVSFGWEALKNLWDIITNLTGLAIDGIKAIWDFSIEATRGMGIALADSLQASEHELIGVSDRLSELLRNYNHAAKELTVPDLKKQLADIDEYEQRIVSLLNDRKAQLDDILRINPPRGDSDLRLENLDTLLKEREEYERILKILRNLRSHVEEDLSNAFSTAQENIGQTRQEVEQFGDGVKTTLDGLPEFFARWKTEFFNGGVFLDSAEMLNGFMTFLNGSEAEFRAWVQRNREEARKILDFEVEVPHGIKDIIQHELSLQKAGEAAKTSQKDLGGAVMGLKGVFQLPLPILLAMIQGQKNLETTTESAGTAIGGTAKGIGAALVPALQNAQVAVGGVGAAVANMAKAAKQAGKDTAEAGKDIEKTWREQATEVSRTLSDMSGAFSAAADFAGVFDDAWAQALNNVASNISKVAQGLGNLTSENPLTQLSGVFQIASGIAGTWNDHEELPVWYNFSDLLPITYATDCIGGAIWTNG